MLIPPQPPYFAVIFTSTRTNGDHGYDEMTNRMVELAEQQPGFLGVESARVDDGITVSYWADLESIKHWKANAEHLDAQKSCHNYGYECFKVLLFKSRMELRHITGFLKRCVMCRLP